MNNNNISIAPQTQTVHDLYEVWQASNFGTEEQFYEFMTTPSAKRTAFLAEHQAEVSIIDNFMMEVF